VRSGRNKRLFAQRTYACPCSGMQWRDAMEGMFVWEWIDFDLTQNRCGIIVKKVFFVISRND
jgi:hypothetical protein